MLADRVAAGVGISVGALWSPLLCSLPHRGIRARLYVMVVPGKKKKSEGLTSHSHYF